MTNISPDSVPIIPPRDWARRFFPIWGGSAFSLVGTILVQFAIVWWFAKFTGSATALAFGGAIGLLPAVLIGPFAGVLVDRWSRRMVLIVSNLVIAVSTLALVALFATNTIQIWHVYLALFVRSVSSTFLSSAMQASTSLMVPAAQLTRIAGLNHTLTAVANIAAPPVGALLVSILPIPLVLVIDVAAALLAIVPLTFIPVPQPGRSVRRAAARGIAPIWHDLVEGFHYMTASRGLLSLGLLAAAMNFLAAPLSSLVALLVTKYLGGDALKLGTLTSLYGIGMLIGAVSLGVWGGFKHRIVTTLAAFIGTGLSILLLGLSPVVGFPLAVVAMVLDGFFIPFANGPIDAVLQATVAQEKQGRVFNLVYALAGIAMPLGLVIAGPLADWVGLPAVLITTGVLTFLVGGISFGIAPLMNLEKQAPEIAPQGVPVENG